MIRTIHKYNLKELATNKINGFSLIEIMLACFILALLTLIAVPSYNHYQRGNEQQLAQQQGLKLANKLQHWRARHFTYAGFSVVDSFDDQFEGKYSILLMDAEGDYSLTDVQANGQGWRMMIQPKSEFPNLKLANYYYLDSLGNRCVFTDYTNSTKLAEIGDCQTRW